MRITTKREILVISSYDPFEGKVRTDKFEYKGEVIYVTSDAILKPKLSIKSAKVLGLLENFRTRYDPVVLASDLSQICAFSRGAKWSGQEEPFYRHAGRYYHKLNKKPSVQEVMDDFNLSRKQITKIYHDETGYNLKELIQKLLLVALSNYCRENNIAVQDAYKIFGWDRADLLRKDFKNNFNLPIEALSTYEVNTDSIKYIKDGLRKR